MKALSVLALAVALSLPLAGAHAASKNIVETAENAGTFKTLLKAATAAGLADKLKGEGPYTVFAPTDEAFTRLPAGKLDSLLKPENMDELAALLQHHIVPGKVLSIDVRNTKGAKELKTAHGSSLNVDGQNGLKVGTAKIVTPDITASNGIVHVIDQVLLPKL